MHRENSPLQTSSNLTQTPHIKRRSAIVSALAVLALTIGGCSSSNDDAATDDPTAEQSDGTTAEGGEDSGSDGESGADCGSAESGGSGGGGGSSDGSSGSSGGGDGSANGQSVDTGTSTGIDPDAGTNQPTATIERAGQKQSFLLIVCDDQGPSSLSASGDDLNAGSILTLSVRDGSGDFEVDDETGSFTLRGDCKNL